MCMPGPPGWTSRCSWRRSACCCARRSAATVTRPDVRVLLVNDLPAGQGGGAEVHLQLLLDGLRSTGDEARVFSRPTRSRLLDVWDRSARATLAREVVAFRPDVLHFHNVVRELSVAVLGAAPGIPRVVTVHDGRLLGDA